VSITYEKVDTVQDLIDVLQAIPDKNLGVRLEVNRPEDNYGKDDPTNYWLYEIVYNPTGTNGYEMSGEVSLFGTE
jgi:hypothetical protein